MFEPDEYIFTKFANFFKRRKKSKESKHSHAVTLDELRSRLTIFARAITGKSIEIYEAEREGGYKNNNFFLPSRIVFFESKEENATFYLFRVLYLSIQSSLSFCWMDGGEHTLEESQKKALQHATEVLTKLHTEFPITKEHHQKYINYFSSIAKKNIPADNTYIYGKWMKHSKEETPEDELKNFSNNVKTAEDTENKTLRNAKAVEEIISVQVDNKQIEDMILQHQFEKVETAEEFGGNFRNMDGDDELDDHSNALEDLNMKYTVRVDDMAHSVYQADFVENTTI